MYLCGYFAWSNGSICEVICIISMLGVIFVKIQSFKTKIFRILQMRQLTLIEGPDPENRSRWCIVPIYVRVCFRWFNFLLLLYALKTDVLEEIYISPFFRDGTDVNWTGCRNGFSSCEYMYLCVFDLYNHICLVRPNNVRLFTCQIQGT